MPEIKIHSAGKLSVINVPEGELLLDSLRSRGFMVYTPCGGIGSCGKCKVYIKNEGYVTSCLHHVSRNLEIVLPEPSEAKILASQYKYSRLLQLNPGKSTDLSVNPFGVAIDIGTTTLVFHLMQLSTGSLLETRSVLNPQIKYGSDVISRINYSILYPGGLNTLQLEIIEIINIQFVHFIEKFQILPNDIVKVCVSGNTTMLHIFLGVNPASIAFAPFTPVFTEEKNLKAATLNLNCNPEGELKILPSFSAYIGADIVAGIASLSPLENISNFLFIDVGTNGEMAVVTPGKIFCTATAAGPAFEGANIEHGMGALAGAISFYDSPDSYQTIGEEKALGICGSGLIDLVASLLKTGIIRDDGYMAGNFIIVPFQQSGTSNDIYLTPNDIRELQLAKSAISAGINILIQKAGLSFKDLDALYLAGGFGNYIRTESAVAIGLIPEELANKVIAVGNTSGTGSMLSLKSVNFDTIIQNILSRMDYLDLSDNENFVLEFAINMPFLK